MLGQIIGELIAAIVGDAVLGTLFPRWSKPELPLEEGQWNASLGAMAAFLASLAATFAGLSSYVIIAAGYNGVMGWFLVGSLVLALAGGRLARRTFKVTTRRHALARIGLWLSRATVVVAVVTAALASMGITVGPR